MEIHGKDEWPSGDTAHWAGGDDSSMDGAVGSMIERLMDVGIDGRSPFRSAQSVADFAVSEHREVEPAIDAIVRSHLRLAAANGLVTSLGGFAAQPVALPANVLGFYLVATRMVAGIASCRGHDIRNSEVRSAVLLALVGADADDLLTKAGDAGSGHLVSLAAQGLPGPVLMAIRKGVMFRLLLRVSKKSLPRLGKAAVVAGALVGAGLDAYLLKRIADHARLEFPWKPGSVS